MNKEKSDMPKEVKNPNTNKTQYVVLDFNPELCNKQMRCDEVILSQYAKILGSTKQVDVSSLLMSKKGLDEMYQYCLSLDLFKRVSKKQAEKEMQWIYLNYFPCEMRD